MDLQTRGTLLVVAGVALLLLTLGVGAAVAPEASVAGTDGENRTLIGIQGGGPGWHEHGAIVAVKGTNVTWRIGDTDSYFDVTRLDNGSIMAGFMDGGYQECGPYESPCTHTGFRIIDPDTSEILYEYSFPVRTQSNSEVHDVEQLAGGEYLFTDMDRERIAVVQNGETVWEWNASSYYEAPADPTRTDWLHINDVDVIEDGVYLVSVRNANQLLVVERGEGVIETINADAAGSDDASCQKGGQLADQDGDGDVRCGDPDVLNHQHNPQWLGGEPGGDGEAAVLVADSDNDRVAELHRRNGEWEVAWTLERAGGIDLRWPRDADRLANGNTLVTDTLNKRIFEVDRNGTVVWSVETERIPYEADRVPQGEPARGEWYAGDGPSGKAAGDGIPVISDAAVMLRGVFPWLPFWYTGSELLLTLASFGLAATGGRDLWHARG